MPTRKPENLRASCAGRPECKCAYEHVRCVNYQEKDGVKK